MPILWNLNGKAKRSKDIEISYENENDSDYAEAMEQEISLEADKNELRWSFPFKAIFSSLEHIWVNISFLERVL